ncbi:MAG: restriction endonuclease [Rhodospirillaceae bacterium]|nr:restriction endonuclease [Rhodospirillaceae bacterium]
MAEAGPKESGMAAGYNDSPDWFTIFRTDENDGWLFEELIAGRLRQGWGAPGFGLLDPDGARVEKTDWEQAYRSHWNGDPSPKRFAILSRMLEMGIGDVVVVPKMPESNQLTVARVASGYRFEHDGELEDFRHVVHVKPQSIRTFDYRADEDAYLVSGLFARANHRSAVSACGNPANPAHVEAVLRLMKRPSCTSSMPREALSRAAIDDVLKEAAESLRARIKGWNGQRFEEAVRQAFRDQGYEEKSRRRFDGQGGDADMVVAPPANPHSMFLPGEIAVQVKWKQGLDEDDEQAVRQIVDWAESQGSDAVKYVISSASEFTEGAKKMAAANDVVLIGGLQTMCFLLGIASRYRDDWEQ